MSMNLNTEQNKAATVASKHALILAGPGTGKTTTLVARYENLIKQGTSHSQFSVAPSHEKPRKSSNSASKNRLA